LLLNGYYLAAVYQKNNNLEKAKSILENNPLIDGHNDLADLIRSNFKNQLSQFNFEDLLNTNPNLNGTNGNTATDIKRLKEGKVSGQFWAIYASCSTLGKDAIRIHMEQLDTIRRLIDKYSDNLQFAKSSTEMMNAFKNKKIASLMGLESGHAIDSSLSLLRIFYSLGIRYMTLTYNCNLPWATNHNVDVYSNSSSYGGLTQFGRKVVQEMNRLGMIVDLSHTSYQTQVDALTESKAPVMFSHSVAYAICNNSRNVKDNVLELLGKNNGIIMINFYNNFLNCNSSQQPTTIKNVIGHLNYIKNLIGVNHIGIGSDYDGVYSVPIGLEDVSSYPNLFAELLNDGWSESDLVKLAGGNVIRVFKDVELYSQSQSKMEPIDDYLSQDELGDEFKSCRTSF
jgi:membrane dipeptidase